MKVAALMFIDNIFRFTQAGSEVRPCSVVFRRRWLSPTLAMRWARDAGAYHDDLEGALSRRQAIYVPPTT